MRWNHLPVAGGLYDQHPRLLEEFLVIFNEKSKHDAAERREQERKTKATKAAGARRPRR